MGEANCRRANTSASSTDALLWFGPDTRSARGRRAESIRTLLTHSNSSSPSECGERRAANIRVRESGLEHQFYEAKSDLETYRTHIRRTDPLPTLGRGRAHQSG